jgi:hypothetical protein
MNRFMNRFMNRYLLLLALLLPATSFAVSMSSVDSPLLVTDETTTGATQQIKNYVAQCGLVDISSPLTFLVPSQLKASVRAKTRNLLVTMKATRIASPWINQTVTAINPLNSTSEYGPWSDLIVLPAVQLVSGNYNIAVYAQNKRIRTGYQIAIGCYDPIAGRYAKTTLTW